MSAPHPPLDPTSGSVGSFDLPAIAKELMRDRAFDKSGRVARTLARSDEMTAVLTTMKEGAEMHDHSAPGPVTLTVISGHISLLFESTRDEMDLRAGSAVVFPKGEVHRVKSIDASAFLIVIGGRN